MRSGPFVSGQNILAQQLSAIRADAYGASSLLVHQQLGFFTLSTNIGNGKTLTLTINGTAVVLNGTTGTPTNPGDFKIQATAALTAAVIYAGLQQPQTSTANFIALSAANQTLVGYLSYALSGTTLTVSSNNTTLYAPLTSFTGATNATSDSFTAQTMQLYVEPGVFYIAGTRVVFAGGSTPTVTAPTSNPRIDVLSINSSGTLSWTTGTENASPVAPTYPNPASNLVLCELYNIVSETALYDNANQTAGQGYIYNDVRTFQQPSMNWGAFPSNLVPDAGGTRNLGSPSFEWNNIYGKFLFGDGSNVSNINTIYSGINLTAGEAVSTNAAVAAGYYQSDGGIQISSSGGNTATGSTGNYTLSLTVAAGLTNSILIVLIRYRANAGTVSSLQWNGSALTSIGLNSPGSGPGNIYGGYIVAPTSGTHSLTWTASGNGSDIACVSYWVLTNVAQTGTIDSFSSFGATSGTPTSTLTPNNVGAFLIAYSGANTGNTGAALSWENQQNLSGTGTVLVSADANKTFPLNAITISNIGSGGVCGLIAIKPFTTATLGAVVNASADNTAGTYADNFSGYRSSAFLGFTNASAIASASVKIAMCGSLSGFSGLTPGNSYYLSNTGGAIATTAGSITRKAGIAIDSTHLVITNVW